MNKPSPDVCDLCSLPLRHGAITQNIAGESYSFCCRGCLQVFRILMEASDAHNPADFKASAIFKKCQALGIIPRSEADLIKKYDPAKDSTPSNLRYSDSQPPTNADQLPNPRQLPLYLNINGMWCPACAWVIEETLKKDPAILNTACYFSTDRVRCEYDPVRTSPEKIMTSIRQLGYGAEADDSETQSVWKRKEFIRFAVSVFLTMNIMMLSFALYSGYLTELSLFDIRMISWPIFIMAGVVFFYGGFRIHRRALSGLTVTAFGMETLISVGASVAFFYSTYHFMQGSQHLYFDTVAMLITLVLLGKTLESRAKDAVVKDLDTFFSLRPKKVRLCTDSQSAGRYVSAEQLRPGDTFLLETDEISAADGIVIEGAGSLDESSLTGEARPVAKKPGDTVRSGSTVIKGQLRIDARRVGIDSILGQMIGIMEKTLERQTPLEGKTDRLLQWFVPGVILGALLTAIGWFVFGAGAETALIRGVTVLVISCPCALGIAIPLTRIAGITVSAREGMLIRDFSSFERAATVNHFVFDKTGTLTQGQWELMGVTPHSTFLKEELLAMAAGLEAQSDHFIALAIQRYAKEEKISPVAIKEIEIFENGVAGFVGRKKIKIGSRSFTQAQSSSKRETTISVKRAKDDFTSRIYMTINDAPAATFKFGDRIKEGAKEMIDRLHAKGYATSLVSGDEDRTTRFIGSTIGIGDFTGDMLPKAKADFVEKLKQGGHVVAMVGDGINDAPALAQSDLALAVHGNHLLGKEVADVSLMRSDPGQVFEFLQLAGRVNRKINQNFFGAFIYNIISIPIAISGMLTPLVAVCAMLLSSLSVIGNTLLLVKNK